MMYKSLLILLATLFCSILCLQRERELFLKKPSILLSIISRNEEHLLPTFLGYIEKLEYPKERISILIQTDHNEDQTYNVLQKWKENVQKYYHRITLKHEPEPIFYKDSKGPNHWNTERYLKILQLRQNALQVARSQWADYVLFIDGDNFILEKDTLNILIGEKKTIIAPMLRLFNKKSAYSNFWGAIDEYGYYKRVDKYFSILNWKEVGTFEVPMVHSTFLIDLRNNLTDKLQFFPIPTNYIGDTDDLLVFADSARSNGIDLNVCNKKLFGYMLIVGTDDMTIEGRRILFTSTIVDDIAYNEPLIRSKNVPNPLPTPSYAGFDEIFMINLKRRTDRYAKMELTMKELGLKWKHFEAVDGKNFSKEKVEKLGIVAMSDFKDPYLERPLTFGEIGCFLSHWYIWEEMVERKLDIALVLEDDVRFQYDFRKNLTEMMRQANQVSSKVQWDLIYLGRKHMSKTKEYYVEGADKLVWAKYSYWTLGYVLTLNGAKKLVAGNPLPKMVPVDEYIPIMFNDHPEKWLVDRFTNRNLLALSADPLLIYPTHYVGDEGYISDTEDTLSHEGEKVEHFRQQKLEEKAKKKEKKEQQNEILDVDSVNADLSQSAHSEL